MARQYAINLKPWIDDTEDNDAAIAGDLDLLRTMLDNLIRNAIRFSPPEATVEVIATIADNTFRVAVRDQGPGLPNSMLANAFDRFVQAPDETRKGRGHGLGLAIAQGVAELHKGSINVRNLPDGGAEFLATLPLATPGEPPSATVEPFNPTDSRTNVPGAPTSNGAHRPSDSSKSGIFRKG